jgi:GTP pyrophosphokinase
MDLYEDEVFVFTPKGELRKFPKGATVLDFAYQIHSNVGNRCTGARINNKVVNLRHQLHSGDQVEIITSNNQTPKQDWLNIVKTSRAKSKIRLALKETQIKEGLFAKEMLERKFKNRKLEMDESIMQVLIRKLGFKEVSDFYRQIADDTLDVNHVLDKYVELQQGDQPVTGNNIAESAANFVLDESRLPGNVIQDDVLVIDQNLKGVDYQLARCCQPIYGDKVFGFVTAGRGIKIHRDDCPNARRLRTEMPYRVIQARWAGKGSSLYPVTLRVVGNDDIGIVNNITSIIAKEQNVMLRSIDIKSSEDGLFAGTLTLQLDDLNKLKLLVKKIQGVKGVKNVSR